MKTLTKTELRNTRGGNVIVTIINWGINTYKTWKRINESNYPIGPIEPEPTDPS